MVSVNRTSALFLLVVAVVAFRGCHCFGPSTNEGCTVVKSESQTCGGLWEECVGDLTCCVTEPAGVEVCAPSSDCVQEMPEGEICGEHNSCADGLLCEYGRCVSCANSDCPGWSAGCWDGESCICCYYQSECRMIGDGSIGKCVPLQFDSGRRDAMPDADALVDAVHDAPVDQPHHDAPSSDAPPE